MLNDHVRGMASRLARRWSRVVRLAFISAAVVFAGPAALAQPRGATLDERLEWLSDQIESRREAQHIAGLSIAIVLDGETVFARGFGLRDVERGIPAQANTVYCIGSTTKHMTAAMVAQMEAEGKLSLDEHPSRLVPGFALSDAEADAMVGYRDLLSHRTGMTRMSLLWYGGTSTFDEMLAGVPRAEAYAPFRTRFLYNNVMYAVAGEGAARADGTTWPAMMRDRIFRPLGMTDATTSGYSFMDMTRAAKGYRWDEDAAGGEGAFEFVPLRHLDAIGPAGSVYATVLDMAVWARTLLNDGVAPDGTRVLSPGVFDTISTETISMGEDAQYGLGVFLRDWNGLRVVEHGGNIDGFASAFALLPEKNAGVSVLMNASSAPIQSEILNVVWTTLFPELEPTLGGTGDGTLAAVSQDGETDGPDEGVPFDPSAIDRTRLAGEYPAGPLPFAITLEDRDGTLVAKASGQPEFMLKAPTSAEAPWRHEGRPAFTIRFVEPGGPDGPVLGMVFTQGPAEFAIARAGSEDAFAAHMTALAEAEAPFDGEELSQFEGDYHFAPQSVDFTALVRNGRLAVSIPGQTAFDLNWPDADGWWTLKLVPGARVRFDRAGEDPAGEVVAMGFEQGGASFTLPRVRADDADLPALAEVRERVRAALGSAAWESGLLVRVSGTSRLRHQGIQGTVEAVYGGTDTLVSRDDMSPYGVSRVVITPDSAWSDSPFTRFDRFDDSERKSALFLHPAAWGAAWETTYANASVVGRREIEGRSSLVVRLTDGDKVRLWLFIDETSWLPSAVEVVLMSEVLGPISQQYELSDYREIGGAMVPMRISGELIQNGAFETVYTRAEMLDAVPAELIVEPLGEQGQAVP